MSAFRLNLIEQGRATEWLASMCLLSFAITLALPGDTLDGASFSAFRDVGFDEALVSTPLAVLAVARLTALYINGAWRRSPVMRMCGAVFGASIFGMLTAAFLWPTLAYGAPISTGCGVYFTLAVFDGLSAYRSGADVRLARITPDQ